MRATDPDPASSVERHFIELATRPLEDHPEIREEARAELMGRLAHAEEAELETALGRMAKVVPQRTRWLAPACWLLWLALLGIAGWQTWRAVQDGMAMNYFGQPDWERLSAHLSPEQKEFVFARYQENSTSILPALERLKDHYPNDPHYYDDYAIKYFESAKMAPPNYRETWQRLDPDNGTWALREAGLEADVAVPRKGPVDEPHLAKALALFAEAANAKHFTRPANALRIARGAMLPQARDMGMEFEQLRFGVSNHWDGTYHYPLALGRTVALQADRLASAKDHEGLSTLISAWEKVAAGMAESPETTMDLIMFQNFLKPSAQALEFAARDLGMAEEEAELQRKQAIFSAANATLRSRGDHRPLSYLAALLGPFNGGLDPALYEPGRKMEYAMLDRGTAVCTSVLLLLVVAGVIFEAFRRGRRVNGMAEGLAPLLRPADGLWCLVLGLLLPLSYYFTVTRLSPLGCRDWGAFAAFGLMRNPGAFLLAPAFIQPAAGLLLVLCCLVQVTRWRIARRMGFLALRSRWHWSAWLVPLLAALVLPLSGIVRWIATPDAQLRFLIASAAAAGLPLLWLLWQAIVGLGAGKERALGGVMLSRNLILPLALLVAFLLAAWLPLKQVEQEWYLKDELTRSDRAHGSLSMGEALIVDKIAKLYRSAFEPLR